MTRCANLSAAAAEPMPGSAPRAAVWVVVEHPGPWGDAALTRSAHGVRVLMARRPRAGAGHGDTHARVWIAHVGVPDGLRVGTVAEPTEVAGWDLAGIAAGSHLRWGRAEPGPLLLVCANGRRDRCCGHEGRRLAEQLGTGQWSGNVLTSTHLGGHRFAPTALLLPFGVLHGRLDPTSAADVLAQAGEGRTPTATVRGFSTLGEPEQVAEAHARQLLGYDRLAPLAVRLDPTPDPDRLRARVTAPEGASIQVDLVRTGRATVASCGRAPEAMTRWTVAPSPA